MFFGESEYLKVISLRSLHTYTDSNTHIAVIDPLPHVNTYILCFSPLYVSTPMYLHMSPWLISNFFYSVSGILSDTQDVDILPLSQ